jgi:hypothetical protein
MMLPCCKHLPSIGLDKYRCMSTIFIGHWLRSEPLSTIKKLPIFPALGSRPLRLNSGSSLSSFPPVQSLSLLEQKDTKETKKSSNWIPTSLSFARQFP